MSLPNFNEVNIPSDSEEEDDYQGIEWTKTPKESANMDLILTLGQLSTTAIQCGVESAEEIALVTEVETGRKGRFLNVKFESYQFIWGSFPKEFAASSLNELTDSICKMNFRKILILEAQASQVASVRPGIYQISAGHKLDLPKLPVGCAAQGLAGAIISRKLLRDSMGDVGFVLLFTESLRSPDLEDLVSFDKILPPTLCSAKRMDRISRFISADKLKDNIYV